MVHWKAKGCIRLQLQHNRPSLNLFPTSNLRFVLYQDGRSLLKCKGKVLGKELGEYHSKRFFIEKIKNYHILHLCWKYYVMVKMKGTFLVLLLSFCGLKVGAYGSNHKYEGDHVPMYANKVCPFHNSSETYRYFNLPLCSPDQVCSLDKENEK